MKQTDEQILLAIHLKELGIITVPEHRFCDRQWRLDLYAPNERLGFEISGGNWTGGHRRGAKQEDEYDKINTAQLCGIRVMQFTNAQVSDGRAKNFVASFLLLPAGESRDGR